MCLGSISDLTPRPSQVRSSLNSGHTATASASPVRAKPGHRHLDAAELRSGYSLALTPAYPHGQSPCKRSRPTLCARKIAGRIVPERSARCVFAFRQLGPFSQRVYPKPELLELSEYLIPNWAWLKLQSRLKKPFQFLFQVLHGTTTYAYLRKPVSRRTGDVSRAVLRACRSFLGVRRI
jgi:hypothetical protein